MLDEVVSGYLWVAEERKQTLELGILLLGRADVMDELGLAVAGDGAELKLVGLEKRAWRSIGRFAPLGKVMSSRHGIWLAHGLAGTVDDREVVVGKELGPSGLTSVENLGRGEG